MPLHFGLGAANNEMKNEKRKERGREQITNKIVFVKQFIYSSI